MTAPIPLRHVVVLGALGDLAARLLLPGIAELAERGELPHGFALRGVDVDGIDRADFREHVAGQLGKHARHIGTGARRRLVDSLDYRRADLHRPGEGRAAIASSEPVLVYAALPPPLFPAVVAATSAAELATGSRLAIEKPLALDQASASALEVLIARSLVGTAVSRVDHFLADENTRRVVELRRENPDLAAAWSNAGVERVDIVLDETLGHQGRGYFDSSGALRDVVQNHLLSVLSLVAMEDRGATIDARVAALRAVVGPEGDEVGRRTVRARYAAGVVDGRPLRAYVDEPLVDPARQTETYAEVVLAVENDRWLGVPFRLRNGKALPDRREVVISFHSPGPGSLRDLRVGMLQPSLRQTIARPGGVTETTELATPPTGSAYANVVRDLLVGDDTWMVGAEEAREMWRITQPILDAWASGQPPLETYPAGAEPDRLASTFSRT